MRGRRNAAAVARGMLLARAAGADTEPWELETDVAGAHGKKLGGAPRTGRWVRTEADAKAGSQRGTLLALLIVFVLVLGGAGAWLWRASGELDAGLLRQRAQAQRRPDWVPLRALPAYVPAAFTTVVDTTSFERQDTEPPGGEPHMAVGLVRQVYRIGPSLRDQMRELALTPLLERELSPPARLELYLNRVDLGRAGDWPVFGVYQAAREYFDKEPARLTPGEAATLAGLLLPPRISNPDRMQGAAGARRNEVLRRMRAAGLLGQAQYRAALAEPLAFQPGIEYEPMTRPLGWRAEPGLIRLPDERNPALQPPDSAR